MSTITQVITDLPTPVPTRNDPDNFRARADAFLAALPTYATEMNTWAGQANTVAGEVNTNATNAAAAASSAISTANATPWVSGTTYAVYDTVFSPTNFQTYRRKTAGGGVTDPSSDGTNWAAISGDFANNPVLNNPTITGGTFTGQTTITSVKETKVAMAANDVDLSLGNYFTKTFSAGAVTLTKSNIAASGLVSSWVMDMTNAGLATITWFTGIKWAGGVTPVFTASGRDVAVFYSHDGGTTVNGFVVGKAMA